MGYQTHFELCILEGDDNITDYKLEISASTNYSDCFEDSIKWYNHENDMRIYSKKYPNTVFQLYGEGEESGDMWVEYYRNGKMQRSKAIIKFDEYCSDQLS